MKRSQREIDRTERKGLERLAKRIRSSPDWSKILRKMGYKPSANAQLEGDDLDG